MMGILKLKGGNMGYYTDFDISSNSEEVIEAIERESQYEWCSGTLNAKWYDHDKDCLAVSKMYPYQLITVEGDGEEQGDSWVTYYKNGKKQECKAVITFEPFDESKLK